MKKLLGFLVLISVFLASAPVAFAVESLFMAQTQMTVGSTPGSRLPGQFNTSFVYFASGETDGVKHEVVKQSKAFGQGEFPTVLIYTAGAGALTSQEAFSGNGFLNYVSKLGVTKLTLTQDPNNPEIVFGLLTQDAAGISIKSTGLIDTQTQFGTVPDLIMQNKTTFLGPSLTAKGGAIRITTEGFGPAPGQTGETASAITFRWEEHVTTSGNTLGKGVFPAAFQYGVSFGPVSILPK